MAQLLLPWLEHNAIAKARKPTWDRLWQNYPHTLIHASEAAVGLPSNQMGNDTIIAGNLNCVMDPRKRTERVGAKNKLQGKCQGLHG